MSAKNFSKFILPAVIVVAILAVVSNSYTVISPNERGIKVTLGQVEGGVLQPGMAFHAPFITVIRKFRLEPKTYEVSFSCGQDGAITKDMQTVGSTVAVRYVYDENRIMDIVTRFQNDSVIQSAMRDNVKASLTETVGQYSIYDLVEKQNEVTGKVAQAVLDRMVEYPIAISQTTITNWDWSDDFDKQIKETANRAQEVKKAEQDLKLTQTNAQKKVAEAQASKEAAELTAEAELIKAQREAEAKMAEADGIAYYNAKISQNMTIQREQWQHDEQMAYYEKWDGKLVPTYIPLTAAGGIVNLPAASSGSH